MSGSADSETPAAIPRPDATEDDGPRRAPAVGDGPRQDPAVDDGGLQGRAADGLHDPAGDGGLHEPAKVARRARWTAGGAGALLALAGLAASLLRLAGAAPAPVGGAYAVGAALCALAALLGFRGRTRRALWLMVAGVMVMALGDQSD